MNLRFNQKNIDTTEVFSHSVRWALIRGAVIFVGFSCVIGVLWSMSRQELEVVKNLRKDRFSVIQSINRISIILDQSSLASALEKQLRDALPSDFDAVVLIPQELRSIALKRGLRAQADLGDTVVGPAGGLPRIQLRVRADGPLEGIAGFLTDIEANQRLYVIDSFSIGKLGANTFQLVMQAGAYTQGK